MQTWDKVINMLDVYVFFMSPTIYQYFQSNIVLLNEGLWIPGNLQNSDLNFGWRNKRFWNGKSRQLEKGEQVNKFGWKKGK